MARTTPLQISSKRHLQSAVRVRWLKGLETTASALTPSCSSEAPNCLATDYPPCIRIPPNSCGQSGQSHTGSVAQPNGLMRPPTAAQKRCLLQAVEDVPAADGGWHVHLTSAHAALDAICQSRGSPGPRGRDRQQGSATAAVVSWAALLVDLVKRAKASLDAVLSNSSSSFRSLQPLLELTWLQLDAFEAVRHGWSADAVFLVSQYRLRPVAHDSLQTLE